MFSAEINPFHGHMFIIDAYYKDEVSRLKDILHTASRELHSVSRLVDNTIREEKEERSNTGAERYTPSRDASSTSGKEANHSAID